MEVGLKERKKEVFPIIILKLEVGNNYFNKYVVDEIPPQWVLKSIFFSSKQMFV